MRASPGQASIEWVGLLALLSVVIGLAVGGAASQGVFVGRSVTRQMARALCVVGHGDCRRDREACTTSSHADGQDVTLSLFVVRLGGGTQALVQRRSDGTIAITRAAEGHLGLDVSAGYGTQARFAGFDVALGGEVQAAIMASRRQGQTWITGSVAEAADLLDRLDHQAVPSGGKSVVLPPGYVRRSLPPADIDYHEGDLAESLGVGGHAGLDGADHATATAGAEVSWDARVGARTDHRTGHRTSYATASWTATGRVEAGGGTLWSPGDAGGGEVYEVEADAAGRPLDLRVITTGPYRGGSDLPAVLSGEQGLLDVPAGRGERAYVVTAHLDLTDPESLAAARGLVGTLGRTGLRLGSPAATAASLRRRIEQAGTIEAQVVERDSGESRSTLSVTAGVVRTGFDAERERSSTHLLAALSRGLDGQWLPRDDCVARAWPAVR